MSGNHGVEAARPLTVTSNNLAEDLLLPSRPRGIHRTGGPGPQSSRERGLFLHVEQRLPGAAGVLLLWDQRLVKGLVCQPGGQSSLPGRRGVGQSPVSGTQGLGGHMTASRVVVKGRKNCGTRREPLRTRSFVNEGSGPTIW